MSSDDRKRVRGGHEEISTEDHIPVGIAIGGSPEARGAALCGSRQTGLVCEGTQEVEGMEWSGVEWSGVECGVDWSRLAVSVSLSLTQCMVNEIEGNDHVRTLTNSHDIADVSRVGQVGISMVPTEVVLGRCVDQTRQGGTQLLYKDLLRIRALHSVHAVVAHGEVLSVH